MTCKPDGSKKLSSGLTMCWGAYSLAYARPLRWILALLDDEVVPFSVGPMTYRAYRVPYEWVPQVAKPVETPIEPLNVSTFRVPGAAAAGDRAKEVTVEGCQPYEGSNALCVASVEDPKG